MKYLIPLIIGCLLAGSGCDSRNAVVPETDRTRYIVGLSPFLDKERKDEIYQGIVRLVVEKAPLNSVFHLYDGYHLQTITTIDIPAISAFKSTRTRANQFRKQIQNLRDFLAQAPPSETDQPLDLSNAVRFPQFLEFVSENLFEADVPTRVIVLGSPLYVDTRELGFSMLNGYFPSDGHLKAPQDKSVYSLERRENALKDVVIDFGYPRDPWISDIHRQRVARFWTLYSQMQGAKLHRFTGDLATVFDSATSSTQEIHTPRTECEIDPESQKPEMIRITRDIGMTDWITSEVPRNLGVRPPSRTRGPMKIGIRWTENIDLDLYAKPGRNRETLFFQNTDSDEGYYFKDHRSSPQNEYEYIEFEKPVDVWDLRASVNFYEGRTSAPGPSGEIRIEFDNHTYVGRFSIPKTKGNRGNSDQDAYWSSIDVPKILKLR